MGGGIDLYLSKRFGIRIPQVDVMSHRYYGIWSNEVRLGFGMLIH